MPTEHYWYKKDEDGMFVLMFGEDKPESIVYRTQQVAVAYSGLTDGQYCLHKHGRPDLVQKWFSNLGNKLRKEERIEEFKDFAVMTSDLWEVDDLNKLVENETYITDFMNSQNSKLIQGLHGKNVSDGNQEAKTS